MDQQTYQRWWPLHVRVPWGETLGEEELASYQAGLREAVAGEITGVAPGNHLRDFRSELATLEKEREELLKQWDRVEAEIASLEAALLQRAGRQ